MQLKSLARDLERLDTADRFGVLAGYRNWSVFASGELVSLNNNYRWKRDSHSTARCVYECDRTPSTWHRCGLHAYYELPQGDRTRSRFIYPIRGSVLSWGPIVHHETYYRSLHALPIAFVVPPLARERMSDPSWYYRDMYQQLLLIADRLGAEIVENESELIDYTQQEVGKW